MCKCILLAGIAAVTLISAGGNAMAQSVRDLTVVQSQAYEAGKPKPGSLTVMTLLDRADATYAVGEAVRIGVKTSEDAYVTVLNIGASGKVTRLFPNAYQTDNRIKAGETIEIPGPQSGTRITVGGPVGAELIKVIATSKPIAIIPEAQLQGSGMFRSLDGDVEALNRDLEVVATKPPADTKIAVANQVIKTIPARIPGTQAAGALIVPAVPAGPSGAVVPSQTFPLLLAADKPTYKVGEKLTLAVTSLQPCHLTVVSTNSNGKARVLFPSSAMPNTQVGALQTVMISGGPAPQAVIATGPATETIVALCTTEPRPQSAIKAAETVVSDEEKAALDRDLAVVPTRPAGTTGFAQITIAVSP